MTAVVEKKPEQTRKVCTHCSRNRRKDKFRLLSSGYRQSMCIPCEREWDRERWHRRRARG